MGLKEGVCNCVFRRLGQENRECKASMGATVKVWNIEKEEEEGGGRKERGREEGERKKRRVEEEEEEFPGLSTHSRGYRERLLLHCGPAIHCSVRSQAPCCEDILAATVPHPCGFTGGPCSLENYISHTATCVSHHGSRCSPSSPSHTIKL